MNACATEDFYSAILELFGYSFYFNSLQATKTCVTRITFKVLHTSLFFVFDKPFLKEKKTLIFAFCLESTSTKKFPTKSQRNTFFEAFGSFFQKQELFDKINIQCLSFKIGFHMFDSKSCFGQIQFIFSPK